MLQISLVRYFTFHSQKLAIIPKKKRTPKIFAFAVVTETGVGKSCVVVNLSISSEVFGKYQGSLNKLEKTKVDLG